MARYDDLNTKTLGYITFLSVVLLIVAILLLQALTYNWIGWQEEAKLTKQSYHTSDLAIQKQKDSLESYGKVTEQVPVQPQDGAQTPPAQAPAAQGTQEQVQTVERIRIPIERAEELLLEEVKSKSAKTESTPST